jgi:hypothetical protein
MLAALLCQIPMQRLKSGFQELKEDHRLKQEKNQSKQQINYILVKRAIL